MSDHNLTITIDNIDEVQAGELIRFLWLMEQCGIVGASRWLAFYADGDGALRPKIHVNGHPVSDTVDSSEGHDWDNGWRKGNVEAYLFDPD